jgi:hypothetical protein
MAMFLSPTKYVEKVTSQLHERLKGQEVLAVALFQPKTALTAEMSKGDTRRLAKRSAAFAVTPEAVHVFGLKDRGYTNVGRVEEQLAVLPRAGMRVSTGRGADVLQLADNNIRLATNVVTLHLADGRSVQLSATVLSKTVNAINEGFVRVLTEGGAQSPV